jgi:hypothetical protein
VSRHNKKRRRKTTAPQVPPRPPKRSLAQRIDDRPKAPWDPFPLVEIVIFAGIVCLAVGFFATDGSLSRGLVALGIIFAGLGGLETTVREHFAGYRSHTLVLAAVPAVGAGVVAALLSAPPLAVPPLMLLVFAAGFAAARLAWRRTRNRSPA